MKKRYVIIGNGTAAAGCIEGIRSADASSPITVVSAEKYPVYCRPLISYYLEGKTDPEKMSYRGKSFYSDNGCEVIYGKKAVSADPESRIVKLDDGTELPYSSLCVAAGSSPFVPPFEGLDTVEKKFPFMTLDDAEALKAAVNDGSRVLIIGAGLIGLKCAEGIRGLVKEITVCDLADRVLSSILDADCAAIVRKRLEQNGISFLLSDSAVKFDKNTAYMKSGKKIGFDVLVLAVGVRANSGLVKDMGGEVGRGVVVDEYMRSSIDGVFAAGDCAEGYDVSLGQKRVLALMPNAYMQGHAAGVNMAGGKESFGNAIPMNSIGFFGLHIMTAGTYAGELCEERDGDTVKRFYTDDGVLKGFMLIGATERAGIYTSLIRERTPLGSIDFETLKKCSTTAVFSQDIRRQKFGGVV